MSKTLVLVPRVKPRNPHAPAARARQAGAHRQAQATARHRGRLQLRAELAALHPPPQP
jgi:hypothetical protein